MSFYSIHLKSCLTYFKPDSLLLCQNVNINLVRLVFISLGMPYYAVAVGKTPGVYKTWPECLNQTNGYPKAKFRKFNTEYEALNFVNSNQSSNGNISAGTQSRIENINRPKFTVNTNNSSSLLKQDKLSLIANKLESFIESTNKTLEQFDNRLQLLESTIFSKNTSDIKRKQGIKKEEEIYTYEPKKRKTQKEVKEIESLVSNATVEEVDNPFRSNYSIPDGFIMDTDGHVIVYTDGACSNNGRKGAKAGIGIWFNHSNPFNVAAPVEGNATNNNAEIQAATRAIQQASLAGIKKLNVHTDSQFMINCMTDWIRKWKKNNWMTSSGGPVKNKDQLILLDEAIQSMVSVKWTHVRGHMGNEGNECADALARNGATMY